MNPRFETLPETLLAGHRLEMSFSQNLTRELWCGFMPQTGKISGRIGQELYSVEIYPGPEFFQRFDPLKRFEKWACVPVSSQKALPAGLGKLVIPSGLYAVFKYVGRPSEAAAFYRTLFTEWLPQSGYDLDNRPHLAIMGQDYKGEDPASEEDIWIPMRAS